MVEDSRNPNLVEIEKTVKAPSERAIDLMFASPAFEEVSANIYQSEKTAFQESLDLLSQGLKLIRFSDEIHYRFQERDEKKEILKFEGEPGSEFITSVTVGNGEYHIKTIDRLSTKEGDNEVITEVPQDKTQEEILKFAGEYFGVEIDERNGMTEDQERNRAEYLVTCFAQKIIGDRFEARFGSRTTTGVGINEKGKWIVKIWVDDPISDSDIKDLSIDLGVDLMQGKRSMTYAHDI